MTARLRVRSIVGTRPEAIKMAPIALAARERPGIDHRLVATGQHERLLDEALTAFGLAPDARMAIRWPTDAPRTIGWRTRLVRAEVAAMLADEPADLILVQGDTTSAYGAALGSWSARVPVGHVEAGLRSHDLRSPWPEEANRVGIDAKAALLFAPTAGAAANLAAEPAVRGQVVITGNSGIDAVLRMRDRLAATPAPSALDRILGADRRPFLLVTCHRRESFGAGIERICDALLALAGRGDARLLLPLHTNPAIRRPIERRLGAHDDILLVPPLDYPTAIDAMRRCAFILTDSGGIQEEAPALGKPVLVLRDVTERPEALATGNLRLVGTDPTRIVAEAARLLDDPAAHAAMSTPAFPYGDGRAAGRIWDAIEDWAAGR